MAAVPTSARCLDPIRYPQLYPAQAFQPRLHVQYWDSHVLVSKILLILGTELYGYNFTEVEGPDWGEAIFVGIQADLWDINLEAWRVGDQLLDPKWAPFASSYGPIGYPEASGPFIINNDVPSEYAKRLS